LVLTKKGHNKRVGNKRGNMGKAPPGGTMQKLRATGGNKLKSWHWIGKPKEKI